MKFLMLIVLSCLVLGGFQTVFGAEGASFPTPVGGSFRIADKSAAPASGKEQGARAGDSGKSDHAAQTGKDCDVRRAECSNRCNRQPYGDKRIKCHEQCDVDYIKCAGRVK